MVCQVIRRIYEVHLRDTIKSMLTVEISELGTFRSNTIITLLIKEAVYLKNCILPGERDLNNTLQLDEISLSERS
jgi:hypothetical protein